MHKSVAFKFIFTKLNRVKKVFSTHLLKKIYLFCRRLSRPRLEWSWSPTKNGYHNSAPAIRDFCYTSVFENVGKRENKKVKIQKFKNPKIRKSENPKIQKSKNPKIQKSKNPKIQKSKNPKIHKSKNPKIQKSNIQN